MYLSHTGRRFIFTCNFYDRHIPKAAHFLWDNPQKQWYTEDVKVAARLREYADDTAKEKLKAVLLERKSWTGDVLTPENTTLYPFQIEATIFALERNRSYLALDPGLGKTPVAATVLNSITKGFFRKTKVIYVAPPFLVQNVICEFEKWLIPARDKFLGTTVSPYRIDENWGMADVVVVPDSLIHKEEVFKDLRRYHDYAKKHKAICIGIVDETHRFKTDTAKRTKALFNLVRDFEKTVFLSGTPMPNSPIELFTVLSNAAPECIDFMNKFEYGEYYCGAKKTAFGWDFSGAQNLTELRKKIMPAFMLRMKKTDVLKELPPKIEEPVILSYDQPAKIIAMEEKLLEHHSVEDLMKSVIASEVSEDGETIHLSTYRKELGKVKAEASIDFIKDILEQGEAVLVFAIHTEVIETLSTALSKFNPIVITGKTPMKERQGLVEIFQNSPANHQLFIGNIMAAGTGFTLTKASRVVFVEFSWSPSDNEQAADRAHRIGQKDSVLVQYLVFKDSIDRTILETNLRKNRARAHI